MKSANKKQPTKKELFENWKREHEMELARLGGQPYDEKEVKEIFKIFGDLGRDGDNILSSWLGNFDKMENMKNARREYLKIAALFANHGFLRKLDCFGRAETDKSPSWIAMKLAAISGDKIYKDATVTIANKDFEPTAKRYKYARYPKGIVVTFDDKAKVKAVAAAEFEPVYPDQSLSGTRWTLSPAAQAEIMRQVRSCKTVRLDTI